MGSLMDTFQRFYASLTDVISEEALIAIGVLSFVMFVGTLIAIPIILSRLPANYFQHVLEHVWMEGYHPVLRKMGMICKNTVGLIFLLAGLAMLLLPGQGILTMVIGMSLLDFPGKRKMARPAKRKISPTVFLQTLFRKKPSSPSACYPSSCLWEHLSQFPLS